MPGWREPTPPSSIAPPPIPVIALITEWTDADGRRKVRSESSDLGGTMRLGAQPAHLVPGSRAREIYGTDVDLASATATATRSTRTTWRASRRRACASAAWSAEDHLVEMIELPDHPWFLACQFHPEFKSTPRDGHPLFTGFVQAALAHAQGELEQCPARP
ncbi:MAG: hypothetical protein KatS3mg124_1665 [Porticoccaceae bacterium]|nr:MAG: hypothetical protein KatS3mg124_1665 [Porticoccaceae bacterium]